MSVKYKMNDPADGVAPAPSGQVFRLSDIQLAIAFLTRLPVGGLRHHGNLADAAWAFPLVGVLVGGFGAALLHMAAITGLPPVVGTLLAFAAMVLVSGALHEDGLADVADGFGGGALREQKLEIMRDSRTGSFGVLVLMFAIGLKVAAVASADHPDLAAAMLLAAATFSRGILPVLMVTLPMARKDGLAYGAGRPTRTRVVVALVLGGSGLLFFLWPYMIASLFMAATGIAGAVVVGILARRQIGGQTGDVIGAAQQVSETAILLTAVVVLP